MSAKGSTLKRVRQARKANERNKHYKTLIKTAVKKVLNENDKAKATELGKTAFKAVDKVASKKIIHKNKAANHKSRVSKHIKGL